MCVVFTACCASPRWTKMWAACINTKTQCKVAWHWCRSLIILTYLSCSCSCWTFLEHWPADRGTVICDKLQQLLSAQLLSHLLLIYICGQWWWVLPTMHWQPSQWLPDCKPVLPVLSSADSWLVWSKRDETESWEAGDRDPGSLTGN